MDLNWLKPLLGRPAPFTTVYLDVTRADSAGESEAVDRWKAVRRSLEHDGAPPAVLDEIGELVARPTGFRGPRGRVIVADRDGVRIDRILSAPPAQSTGVHGPSPALMPAVRAADETVSYLLVEADRTGADLIWATAGAGRTDAARETEQVEGGHDDVHKTREGALARRGQTRAEDSWQRNAEAVAAVLDRRVSERTPELVLLTGDVRAVALVKEACGQHVHELLVEVPGGSRGEGVRQSSFEAKVTAALDAYRVRRRESVLDRFRSAHGRGGGAVTALDDVVEVLRRGQVDELLLSTSASGLTTKSLWVGPDPLQVGTSASDLESIGVTEGARKIPAEAALIRAAVGQDAGLTIVENGAVDLVDGVGAVLRWSDGSTPSESLLTQSADRRRLRNVG